MGLFVIGMIVTLICVFIVGWGSDRALICAPMLIVGAYLYIFIAHLVGVPDALMRGETVFGFFALGITFLGFVADSNTRTTKKGKADKRFKQQTNESVNNAKMFFFFTGLLTLGIQWLLHKYQVIQSIIGFFA